jgi:hypothetical protein
MIAERRVIPPGPPPWRLCLRPRNALRIAQWLIALASGAAVVPAHS